MSIKYCFKMKYHVFTLLLLLPASGSAQTRNGRDYALLFYVTDFQSGWERLRETAGEALALQKELESNLLINMSHPGF